MGDCECGRVGPHVIDINLRPPLTNYYVVDKINSIIKEYNFYHASISVILLQ